ncbi:hypothetical protein [Flavobacterium lindanitolerans]|uniref:Cytochrome B n=1 Tax=Flavobacterium lindanitolerans TaxID=428988 RepID=A0A497UDP9_9FLAO|nr:hypothetical protein [Flavobacterium lindanitolerans]PKW29859.1 hypothetical protein B0G92_1507 [Flavobacterium lindanitolerans]RLJ24199.1 hypothetical protein CLV50_2079 [Flavobacterium lindanitolerans]
MYQTLTFLHSTLRWLVLISLIVALYKAYRGYFLKTAFTKKDNAIRHWTATIAHLQLMIGMTLYFQSPIIKYFLKNFSAAKENFDLLFFGLIHSTLMLIAVIIITIGSAMAKRKTLDNEKFKTMLIWYGLALFLIFIAIPWPFSPFANRPYFR